MTSDALVKAILTEESCELYDRVRIRNLFKNLILGYGKLIISPSFISISYSGGKARKVIYNIPKKILTKEQLSVIQNL